jgi:hypothetical protein
MGAFIHDPDRINMKCEAALDKAGLVVTRSGAGTAGNVKLVDADKEPPYGVASQTTEDPLNLGTYLANEQVCVLRQGIVNCILANDNAAIVAGNPLMAVRDSTAVTPKDGVVDLLTIRTDTTANFWADISALVGWAQEPKAVNIGVTYGTTIKVLLDIRTG